MKVPRKNPITRLTLFIYLGAAFLPGIPPFVSLCFAGGDCPEPGGNTLEACGFIVGVGPFSCPGFRTDDGTIYRIPETGGFETGDRVFVRGTIGIFAATCLATNAVLPLLTCNTIERCFAECGTLTDAASPGCLRFVAADGEEFAILNPGPFGSGETVFVTGFLGETPTQCGPDLLPTLDNDSIGACVSSFGRLLKGNNCTYFQAAHGGRFDLDVTAGFETGDFVFVEGSVRDGCLGPCGFACLRNAINDAFGGTGIITDTAECGVVFEAEITGQRKNRFVLDDFGGFEPGDRVFVAGKFQREDCSCTETDILGRDGCITVDMIAPVFADCGRIQINPGGCAEFLPDAGGGPFSVEFLPDNNFTNTISGKTFVVGALDTKSSFCGAGPQQTIRYNQADPCVEGCGVFGQGIECSPLLSSSTEMQVGVIGAGTLWVENRQGLPSVLGPNPAIAFMKGGLSPEPSVVLCGFPSLRGNLISPCDQGDVDIDGNGIVNLNDLNLFVDLLLLVELAPGAPDLFVRANMNGDFRLNADDIELFVEAFLENFE